MQHSSALQRRKLPETARDEAMESWRLVERFLYHVVEPWVEPWKFTYTR